MRRPFLSRSIVIVLTAGALLVGSLAFAGVAAAATKVAPTTTCSNGVDNSGGLGLICQVTVVNRITANGGSSSTTVRECHGAAGVPTAACTTTVWNMNKLVTRVDQCNGSINGGGGTLRCSVRVTNNFVGLATGASAATVNQCVGSGGSIANNCDPFPATTTSATITQCNGSANGGTLVRLQCTATGTRPSSHSVRINQCNGSANGGGALVICSASIRNVRVSASSSAGSTPTAPPTDVVGTTEVPGSAPAPFLLVGIFALAFVLAGRRLLGIRNR